MSDHEEDKNRKRKSRSKKTSSTSLSGVDIAKEDVGISENDLIKTRQKVFEEINNIELQRSVDTWMKQKISKQNVQNRDLSLLKNIITEYLSSFILFGYDLEGNRIIIQSMDGPKDRDALMEFLKIVFLKQQNENFLDRDEEGNY